MNGDRQQVSSFSILQMLSVAFWCISCTEDCACACKVSAMLLCRRNHKYVFLRLHLRTRARILLHTADLQLLTYCCDSWPPHQHHRAQFIFISKDDDDSGSSILFLSNETFSAAFAFVCHRRIKAIH